MNQVTALFKQYPVGWTKFLPVARKKIPWVTEKDGEKRLRDLYNQLKAPQIRRPLHSRYTPSNTPKAIKPGYYQIDLMDCRRMTGTHNWIMTGVDLLLLTRHGMGVPLIDKTSAETARALEIFTRIPTTTREKNKQIKEQGFNGKTIISITVDEGRKFMGDFTKLVEDRKINLKRNPPYLSKANAYIESFNRTVRNRLLAIMVTTGDTWERELPTAIRSYNDTIHSSIKVSPNQAEDSPKELFERLWSQRKEITPLPAESTVRLSESRHADVRKYGKFKKQKTNWSDEIYTVTPLSNLLYKVKETGEVVHRSVIQPVHRETTRTIRIRGQTQTSRQAPDRMDL